MNGTYILLMELTNDSMISIGKIGKIAFNKGYYVYVGSAFNGLDQRIQRHLRLRKKLHWHIDYLLQKVKIIKVLYKESTYKEECIIAKTLEKNLGFISRFGCRDCRCASHLFYGTYVDITTVIDTLHMKVYPTL